MTDLEKQLLDDLHTQRGNPCVRGNGIRAVALHPETCARARSESDWIMEFDGTLDGYPIVRTRNVEKGRLRVVPAGRIRAPQGPFGFPAVWPSPSVLSGVTELQEWPHDLENGEVYVANGPARGERLFMEAEEQEVTYTEVQDSLLQAASLSGAVYNTLERTEYRYEKVYGAPMVTLTHQASMA